MTSLLLSLTPFKRPPSLGSWKADPPFQQFIWVQISHAALLALLNDTAPESDLSIRAESDTEYHLPI